MVHSQCIDTDIPRQIKVQFVQPTVPHYRVPLFEALAKLPDLEIRVDASPVGISGLHAAVRESKIYRLQHPLRQLFGGRLFWQNGIGLSDKLTQGAVLVINGNPRMLSNWPLILAARRQGVAIVWWGHGWSAGASVLTAAIRRAIMRKMDVLLLFTDAEVEYYKDLGFDAARLFATNNAIDQEPIQNAKALYSDVKLRDFQETANIAGKKILLFCGRLTPKAQLGLGIRALAKLIELDPRYCLVVIGDGQMMEELRLLAQQLNVSDHVIWLGAMLEQKLMAPWFLSAEMFVYPGAIGLSILHAFGYGLPVITHNNRRNQMPEVAALQDGVNGCFYTEGDTDSLVDTIRKLSLNEEKRRSMSRAAVATVSREFSMPAMVSRMHNAIRAASKSKIARLNGEP